MICVGTMKEYTNNAKSVVQLLLRGRENVEVDMSYKVIISCMNRINHATGYIC